MPHYCLIVVVAPPSTYRVQHYRHTAGWHSYPTFLLHGRNRVSARIADNSPLPILTADSCKRGIYKSFEEFKNNAPSITAFDIRTEKISVNASSIKKYDAESLLRSALEKRNTTVFLYDANGELISPSKIFGFSDGSDCWIAHGAFYYPLIRVGNAFEFMYIYHYVDAYDHTHAVEILFPLNMDNVHID